MDNVEIGIVNIHYNEDGDVLSAVFTPTMVVPFDKRVLMQLQSVKASKDDGLLKENADMVLAAWFAKMNEIELADRDDYEVASEILKCIKHQNGMAKECVIKYSFQKIKRLRQ